MLLNYPQNSNLTIMNTIYHRPVKNPETGKLKKDYLTLVYKNLDTGKKDHIEIYRPEYTFYRLKESALSKYFEWDEEAKEYKFYNLFFAHEEDVEPVTCPYTDIKKTIAKITGNEDFFYNNIQSGNFRANEQLHTIPTILGSDIDIEDYYRKVFNDQYRNETCSISKSFFDIEADTINMAGDFPMMGECPINAVSFINEQTNSIDVFLLRNPNNPLIEEFEKSIGPDLINELQEFIIDKVGGPEQAKKFKADHFKFQFRFYDDEIEMIQQLFQLINYLEPDFLLAWNMAFDIPYIIERCKKLGYDPALLLSNPNFKEKFAEYWIDEKHRNEYEARGDFYNIAMNTVCIDQLVQFASRRKGQSQFPNFKLDTAGEIIAKVRKYDYSHITTQISKLPYLDYKTFVFYNIMDTIVQKCIEIETNDIDYIFSKCVSNNTRYAKGHRQTYYLTNRAIKEFAKDNFIFGNNVNKYNPQKVEFEGAIVGDPTHNSEYAKLKQNGEVYNVAKNLDDYDYKSLYPSITRENNFAPNTLIAKIIIDEKVHNKENLFDNPLYDRGGAYIEDLMSGNYVEFAHRWMGLANVREMIEDLQEYIDNNIVPNISHLDQINNRVPMQVYSEETPYLPMAIDEDAEYMNTSIPAHIDFHYYLKKIGVA